MFLLSSQLSTVRGMSMRTYDESGIFIIDAISSMTKFKTSYEKISCMLLFLLVILAIPSPPWPPSSPPRRGPRGASSVSPRPAAGVALRTTDAGTRRPSRARRRGGALLACVASRGGGLSRGHHPYVSAGARRPALLLLVMTPISIELSLSHLLL